MTRLIKKMMICLSQPLYQQDFYQKKMRAASKVSHPWGRDSMTISQSHSIKQPQSIYQTDYSVKETTTLQSICILTKEATLKYYLWTERDKFCWREICALSMNVWAVRILRTGQLACVALTQILCSWVSLSQTLWWIAAQKELEAYPTQTSSELLQKWWKQIQALFISNENRWIFTRRNQTYKLEF